MLELTFTDGRTTQAPTWQHFIDEHFPAGLEVQHIWTGQTSRGSALLLLPTEAGHAHISLCRVVIDGHAFDADDAVRIRTGAAPDPIGATTHTSAGAPALTAVGAVELELSDGRRIRTSSVRAGLDQLVGPHIDAVWTDDPNSRILAQLGTIGADGRFTPAGLAIAKATIAGKAVTADEAITLNWSHARGQHTSRSSALFDTDPVLERARQRNARLAAAEKRADHRPQDVPKPAVGRQL